MKINHTLKVLKTNLDNLKNNKYDTYTISKTNPEVLLKDENECDYQPNDYVYHDNFGSGKVISVEKTIVKVAFKMPYGIKTLMKNHPSIHKIDD